MRKNTLWFLLALSALLLIIGIISYFLTIIPFLMAARPASSPNASQSLATFPVAGFVFTFLCFTASGVVELVGRIGMLIKQAKQQQWAWFVCTLLFGWICQLIYLIVWPQPLRSVAAIQKHTPQRRPVQPQQHHSAQPQQHRSAQPQRKKSR